MMLSGRSWPMGMAVLLFAHALLLLDGVQRNFVVLDEVGHIPAGVSHWLTGSFHAYRANPPLARMLAALPVLAARPKIDLTRVEDEPALGQRPEWGLGLEFIASNSGRYLHFVRLARISTVVWSLLGAWLVGTWARDLYGDAAGLFSACLWCFEPTVLAFGQVVTPDVPATTACLAASYSFWRYLRRPSWRGALGVGLLLGAAQLTKFSLLYLYLLWPLLWIGGTRSSRRNATVSTAERRPRAAHACLILILSVLVINLGYGFMGTGRAIQSFAFASEALGGSPARPASVPENRFRGSWLGILPVPVPSDYVLGLDIQRRDFEARFPSYLAGRWRHEGWWYYYLYALTVKLPLGTWILIAADVALFIARRPSSRGPEQRFLLWHALGLFILVSSQTGFNHHMRYILPCFPFVMISAGKLANLVQWRTAYLGIVLYGSLAWSVWSSVAVHPHSMSYFNEAAGGPMNGHAHLVDSNIDWGQDLLLLKLWLDHHPEARPLGLAYYQVVDPRIVGIEFHLPPRGENGLFLQDREYRTKFGPHPGYFAISVNHLRGAWFVTPDGRGGLRHTSLGDYEYFRQFKPVARVGYSIYIYHITPAEAEAARLRVGLPPLAQHR